MATMGEELYVVSARYAWLATEDAPNRGTIIVLQVGYVLPGFNQENTNKHPPIKKKES